MKRVYAREQHCIGCRLCEVHCAVQHTSSKNILKAFRSGQPVEPSRVRVQEEGQVSFAVQCRHCDNAPCIEACISGAMHRDPETGAVLHEREKCVGCWMCLMVCPQGAIQQGTDHKVASKCDLCHGEKTPACVANCPNEALVFEDD